MRTAPSAQTIEEMGLSMLRDLLLLVRNGVRVGGKWRCMCVCVCVCVCVRCYCVVDLSNAPGLQPCRNKQQDALSERIDHCVNLPQGQSTPPKLLHPPILNPHCILANLSPTSQKKKHL